MAFSPLTHPKPGSVGLPIANVEVRIVNPDDKGVGEVAVRGPTVMKGYEQAPAETAEAIRDGWFHTGDLGCLDRDGYLYLTGRIKELIVTPAGQNVYPEEVCIIGIRRDGEEGESLHAVVVPDFESLKAQKIFDAPTYIRDELTRIAQTLPPYKRVTGLTIVKDPLPRTR